MERRIKAAIAKAIHTPEFALHVGFGSKWLAEKLSAEVMNALGLKVCYICRALEAGEYVAYAEQQMLADLWEQIKEKAFLEITQMEMRPQYFTQIKMSFPAITKLD